MAEHILIDGYNVIHSIKEFKKNLSFGINASAQIFIQEASRLLMIIDKVTLVFDGKDTKTTIDYPYNSKRFCVIYSDKNTTADTLIERIVRESKHPINCTVMTNDHALGDTIRSVGGIVMPSEELINLISGGESVCKRRIISSNNDQSFGNKLFE
ncbi:MAG: NYN domain-containing protein [Puniceicoccales bacterium]|jgi:predicted RNA-binding protein with PIN domain|nr:NYN domain-containing protein [Puniceicoccales bacterium]